MRNDERIVYSINVADLQDVAESEIDRRLTPEEIKRVEDKLGDFIDWHGAVKNAIDLYLDGSAD